MEYLLLRYLIWHLNRAPKLTFSVPNITLSAQNYFAFLILRPNGMFS